VGQSGHANASGRTKYAFKVILYREE